MLKWQITSTESKEYKYKTYQDVIQVYTTYPASCMTPASVTEPKEYKHKTYQDVKTGIGLHHMIIRQVKVNPIIVVSTDIKYSHLLLPTKFRLVHERCGHQTVTKTLSHVRDPYMWEGIQNDGKDMVNKCGRCQVNKMGQPERNTLKCRWPLTHLKSSVLI